MTEPRTPADEASHPSPAELADLAADALPAPHAAEVSAHIEGCGACHDLLAAAEGVGSLLRSVEYPPMPDDVAARLYEVVRREVASARIEQVESSESVEPVERLSAFEELKAAGAITEREAAVGGPRLLHRPQGAQITRRDRRAEQRRESARRLPWRQALLVAASAIVIAGVGAGVVDRVGGSAPAGDTSTASQAESAAALVSVTKSGRDYTSSGLDTQVRALVAAPPTPLAGTDESTLAYSGQDRAPGNQTLLDPAALAACLTTIGADGQRPVAVDLATYEGRDVAVIVLPGRSGGFEVSVVARDCRPGADGTLAVKSVPE